MPWKFNPFTGALDQTGSGGGGSSYIDGEVATYNDLPLDGTAALDSAWLVRSASGSWLTGRKPAGIYIRTATGGSSRDADYTYAGIFPDVFSDANFAIYDNGDSSKVLNFQLSGISANTTRTLTVPNASGTIVLTSDIPTTFAASAITSGTFDNARINFAAPAAIGNTTANTGAFTTLTANNGTLTASAPVLDLSQTWNNAAVTFTGLRLNVTNTASASQSALLDLQIGGSSQFAVWRNNTTRFFGAHLTWFTTVGFETSAAINGATPVRFCAQSTSGEAGIRASGNIVEVMGATATNPQELRIFGTFASATNYQRLAIKTKSVTLSALSGASVATTGGFIPDGAVLVGLTTRVSTAITGATGYDIGDGTDTDRWGANIGVALNTSSDNTNWTATTIQCFTAAQEVTLTAVGSNFTGGAVVIVAHYLAGEAD